jgi:hypothetical protein
MFNKKKEKQMPRFAISSRGLEDSLLAPLVHATVAETYAINWPGILIEGRPKEAILNACGTIKNLIRECGPPQDLVLGLDPDIEAETKRERLINRINVLVTGLNISVLENGAFDCDPLILLESLLINLRNEVSSHQAFMGIKKREK